MNDHPALIQRFVVSAQTIGFAPVAVATSDLEGNHASVEANVIDIAGRPDESVSAEDAERFRTAIVAAHRAALEAFRAAL